MNKNISVIIDMVENGYLVRPVNNVNEELMVFQDKGIVSTERDNQETKDTLFGFLDLHFSDNEKDYNRSLE